MFVIVDTVDKRCKICSWLYNRMIKCTWKEEWRFEDVLRWQIDITFNNDDDKIWFLLMFGELCSV